MLRPGLAAGLAGLPAGATGSNSPNGTKPSWGGWDA